MSAPADDKQPTRASIIVDAPVFPFSRPHPSGCYVPTDEQRDAEERERVRRLRGMN